MIFLVSSRPGNTRYSGLAQLFNIARRVTGDNEFKTEREGGVIYTGREEEANQLETRFVFMEEKRGKRERTKITLLVYAM